MSLKGLRSVAFESQVKSGEVIEDKCYCVSRALQANKKEVSRSRCRARSRSWSRFRARRAKSQEAPSSDQGSTLKRDLSLVSLVRTASRTSVRSLVKLFETRWMNEGRKTQIVLLDERRLDIIIQPKLNSNDLLDLVASHFKLKEKHYFGLGFFDDTNNFNWLQGERRVLDHEFPKKTGLLILHFSIRFFVETIGLLRDSQTVELFYLNARLGVFRGLIECDAEITFELAAHVLQETFGDFVSNDEAKEDLKKLPVIPTNTLKQHPSITYCEERVIHYYTKLTGTSRGLAIVNYMNIIEKLPTYGIHYYNVKDKKDIPWWLGISPKGIAVYDMNDKTTPRKIFTWKNLENLYYRERKFSIEVHGPKREGSEIHIIHTLSSFNPYEDAVREPAESKDDLSTAISDPTTQVSVSRRTFGASNVDVHAWFASTAQLTKCIWSMAVEQHQFYLDRKQSKGQLLSARSMSEIAAELCSSSTSLPGSTGSDLSRSPSSQSLPSLSNSRYDLSIEQSDSIKAERDMYQALKARKDALEEALRKKIEELKSICLQEGELTGELPQETPLAYGEPPPVFRRRVGTAFTLSVKNVKDVNNLSNEVAKLELEVELQGKITSAAQRLASDKTVSKYVHKQRKQSYSKALVKLKEMEKKLAEMHKQVGKGTSTSHHHHIGKVSDGNKVLAIKNSSKNIPNTEMFDDVANRTNISPSHSSPQLYSSQMTSHKQQNPIGQGIKLVHTQDVPSRLQMKDHSKQENSYESSCSSNNMYNVSSQRTSHYQSADHLKSPATSEPGHIYSSISTNESSLTKHRSGEEPFLRAAPNSSGSYLHYGSLDRKRQNYRQDALRDLSPLGYRSHNVGHTERRNDLPNTGGYKDATSPSHNPEDHARHLQDHQVLHPPYKEDPHQKSGSSNLSYNAVRCYSPRMYEGVSGRAYHDIDVTHVHSKETYDHGLLAAHHTTSQPVFHRTERSISPVKLHHQENTYLRPHPPSGFDSHNMSGVSYQKTVDAYIPVQHSETHTSSPPPAHHIEMHSPGHAHIPHNETHLHIHHHTDKHIPTEHVDPHLPSHLPIQHGESSGHQYTHKGSPSSPHSPASYASSAVVTVTRMQPHTELTKPYEISDFYRYSEKLRRQRIIDQYQRQLMGVDKTSRSSSPLSIESDGHSSHSSSTSSNPVSQSPSHNQSIPFSGRPPLHPYSRSSSAPLHSVLQPSLHSMPPHVIQPLSPEGQIISSSSYSVKSQGTGMNYAMQTSSIKVHQVHTATKHSVYQPPQPMTCNPVRNPPYKKQ